MKKTFTRKELLHSAIRSIRFTMNCSIDSFKSCQFGLAQICYNKAFAKSCILEDMNIISSEKSELLGQIIDNIWLNK